MASVVKIKRSSVQGKAPTTGNLETGELALNLRDQKLFSSNGSVVFEIGSNTTSSHIGTLTVGNSSPYTFPTSDGSENFVLKTDGSGTLSFVSVASVSSNTSLDNAVSTGNTTSREITVGGLTVGAITFPNTDGTDGQVLTTDGNGTLSFQTISSGGASDVDFEEYIYTASLNQQSFSGADDNGDILSYVEGKLVVFLNGVSLLANTDYLASNGTSVFLTSGTSNNDIVVVHTFTNIAYREYQYTSSESQQSFVGTDDNNNFLRYSPDNISVFLNGILLIKDTDYLASNTTSVFLTSPASNNDVLTIQSYKQLNGQQFFDGAMLSNSSSTTTATEFVVDTFNLTEYRSAKYLIQITANENDNKFQIGEVLLIHNGSSTFMTEYGTVATSSNLGTVDSDIDGDLVRLLVTPTDANTTIKVIRTTVAI
jgi:hypothetical protein